jgi:putative FmdB family regulatory protein
MPLYEYQCDACGRRFELIRKFSDDPLEECPHCGAAGAVRKLMSSPAFQFKGSGWYITDYTKKNQATSEASDSNGDKEKGAPAKEKSASGDKPATTEKADAPATKTAEPAASSVPAANSSKKGK